MASKLGIHNYVPQSVSQNKGFLEEESKKRAKSPVHEPSAKKRKPDNEFRAIDQYLLEKDDQEIVTSNEEFIQAAAKIRRSPSPTVPKSVKKKGQIKLTASNF